MALTKATQAVIAVDICTTDTAQTITGVKTFTSAISAPNMVTTDTAQTITGVKTISNDTLINGLTVGKGGGNIASNTASGQGALLSNTTGVQNTASGKDALYSNTTGSNNTASGLQALYSNTTGNSNTASGVNALYSNTTGNSNTASGVSALQSNTIGYQNTASGGSALFANTTGFGNTAIGYRSLESNTTGVQNTASGAGALLSNTTGYYNTASGVNALRSNTTGYSNTANGVNALYSNTTGYSNTANGESALYFNTTGIQNTASGQGALQSNTTFSNIGGFGYNSQVTASNQIQLGDASTTTYAYGAVQNRSDIRDKSDVRDTELGLEFVNALRPVDFKWDLREDYRPEAPKYVAKPAELKEDASDEDKAKYAEELAAYEAYVVLKDKWLEDVKLANIVHDGSKKRNRFHHGLIAQEVKAVLDAKGIDFGGFQDHSVKGGDDVLSVGYEELIAPLIKAVQELSAEVAALKAK